MNRRDARDVYCHNRPFGNRIRSAYSVYAHVDARQRSVRQVKRSDARLNRERILEAAKQVFAEQGIAAEVKDIADRAGLGIGTLYRNFPGKDDLLVEVVRGLAGEIAAALGEGEDEADPIAGLRTGLVNVYGVAANYGWLLHAKLNQQLPRGVQTTLKPPYEDSRYQAVIRMVERAKAQGLIRPEVDPNLILVLMFSTIGPLLHMPVGSGWSGEDLASAVLDIVLNGVAMRPPA